MVKLNLVSGGLEEEWKCIARSRPGEHPTILGTKNSKWRRDHDIAHAGVMTRFEFLRAVRRGQFDRMLGTRVFDQRDNARMQRVFMTMVAFAKGFKPRLLFDGGAEWAIDPFAEHASSVGADFDEEQAVLKSGFMLGMKSQRLQNMASEWRQEDGEEEQEQEQIPEAKMESDDLHAVVKAYDAFHEMQEEGCATFVAPDGTEFKFSCKQRPDGKLDFYSKVHGKPRFRSRRDLIAFLS